MLFRAKLSFSSLESGGFFVDRLLTFGTRKGHIFLLPCFSMWYKFIHSAYIHVYILLKSRRGKNYVHRFANIPTDRDKSPEIDCEGFIMQ